jgi:hypothetical protein
MENRISSIIILIICLAGGILGTYFVDKMEIYAVLKLQNYDAVYLHEFSFSDYLKGRGSNYLLSSAFLWRAFQFQALTLLMIFVFNLKYVKYVVVAISMLLLWGSYDETQIERGDIHFCEFCSIWQGLHFGLALTVLVITGVSLFIRSEWRVFKKNP